jgi:hypothetical protein
MQWIEPDRCFRSQRRNKGLSIRMALLLWPEAEIEPLLRRYAQSTIPPRLLSAAQVMSDSRFLSCHHERPLGREGSAVFPSRYSSRTKSRFLASLVMTISEANGQFQTATWNTTYAAIYSRRAQSSSRTMISIAICSQ